MKCVRKDVCNCWKINFSELERFKTDVSNNKEYEWVNHLRENDRLTWFKVENKNDFIFRVLNLSGQETLGFEGDYLVLYTLGDAKIYSQSIFESMFSILPEDVTDNI